MHVGRYANAAVFVRSTGYRVPHADRAAVCVVIKCFLFFLVKDGA